MRAPTHNIAVLTGDLTNSTKLGPEKINSAFKAMRACAAEIEGWMSTSLNFTQHRGDGWQVAFDRPEYALRSALAFRAALRSLGREFGTSIGVAEGEIEGSIGPNLNTETAEPFVISGRALDIARRQKHQINHASLGAVDGMAILLDRVSKEWTPAQAQAMRHALHPHNEPNYTDIGEILGKSRQAVSKSLEAAWCNEVRYALTMLEGGQ